MGIQVGDTVLAYHGLLIYDAKVLKVDHGKGVIDRVGAEGATASRTQFYVHYQGWAKKWDEWVRYDRVLEDTPAHRQQQQRAKDDVRLAQKTKKRTSRSGRTQSKVDTLNGRISPFKRLKRNVATDCDVWPESSGKDEHGVDRTLGTKPMNLQMPFGLKKQLVEDWQHVTQVPYQVVPLPRRPNVKQIIATYLDLKQSKVHEGDVSEEKEYKNVRGMMEGVQSYFDRALSSLLLYRMERPQYQELIQKQTEHVPLSQIYGAEHLIRLFVRLPILLASSNVSPRELHQIQARLNDFLKFVQKNSAAWFVSEYEAAPDKYVEQVTAT